MHPGGEILDLLHRRSSKDWKGISIEVSPEHSEFVLPLIRAVTLRGHFELSCGNHSSVYVQTGPLFSYSPVRAKLAAALLSEAWSAVPIGLTTTVVAMAHGATVFGTEVARQLSAKFLYMEPHEGGMYLRRGQILKENDKVLLLDNVVTSGGTLDRAEAEIRERVGSTILGRVALLDRRPDPDDILVSLARLRAPAYTSPPCPLCQSGVPLVARNAVKGLTLSI